MRLHTTPFTVEREVAGRPRGRRAAPTRSRPCALRRPVRAACPRRRPGSSASRPACPGHVDLLAVGRVTPAEQLPAAPLLELLGVVVGEADQLEHRVRGEREGQLVHQLGSVRSPASARRTRSPGAARRAPACIRRLEKPVVCTDAAVIAARCSTSPAGVEAVAEDSRAAGHSGNIGSCTSRPENDSWSVKFASMSAMRGTTHMSSSGAEDRALLAHLFGDGIGIGEVLPSVDRGMCRTAAHGLHRPTPPARRGCRGRRPPRSRSARSAHPVPGREPSSRPGRAPRPSPVPGRHDRVGPEVTPPLVVHVPSQRLVVGVPGEVVGGVHLHAVAVVVAHVQVEGVRHVVATGAAPTMLATVPRAPIRSQRPRMSRTRARRRPRGGAWGRHPA